MTFRRAPARAPPDGPGKDSHRGCTGEIHALFRRGTHLGGLLRCTGAERGWDRSCRGSRFDVDGAVLEGPA